MTLRLNGSTSGYAEIDAPAVAGSNTLLLPASNGSAYQFLRNGATAGTTEFAAAITSGTAVASTSGTSVDFTSIPSYVKRITVMFNAVSTSGSSIVQVQIGSGSVTTSGYAGSSTGLGGATTTTLFTSGLVLFTNNESSSAVRVGQAVLTLVSGNIWSMTSNIGLTNIATICLSASVVTLGGACDRVRITTVNGTDTFDAGSINILYEG